MSAIAAEPLPSPLRVEASGTVRIGSTRVTLDRLFYAYRDGNTAEEIVQQFPSLDLAEVYAAIAYLLTHEQEVAAYLKRRAAEAARIKRQAFNQPWQKELRATLLARRAGKRASA